MWLKREPVSILLTQSESNERDEEIAELKDRVACTDAREVVGGNMLVVVVHMRQR